MKFPRNARTLRTPSEIAPFAAVFFLLVIFLMLAGLLPVPGLPVQLQPPGAVNLPGVAGPVLAMAVDSEGRLYFRNQLISEPDLQQSLRTEVSGAREPLTLVIHADKSIRYDQLTHLVLVARDAGITNALLATLPRVTDAPANP